MILPIVAYGHPVLRKEAADISSDYPNLSTLIEDMYETMYHANGVGLAAPQINKSIRLLVIDASPLAEDFPEVADFKKTFINLRIVEEFGEEWAYNEGCLSVPEIHEDVTRKSHIRIQYMNEKFVPQEEEYSGFLARVIQHESDHLNGKVFVDRLPGIKKMLLKRKLSDISKGAVGIKYKMIFPELKKGRRG